jgi:hypothetical protein
VIGDRFLDRGHPRRIVRSLTDSICNIALERQE